MSDLPKDLLEKYIKNECSVKEKEELFKFLEEYGVNFDAVEDVLSLGGQENCISNETSENLSLVYQNIQYKINKEKRVNFYKLLGSIAAACVLMFFIWNISFKDDTSNYLSYDKPITQKPTLSIGDKQVFELSTQEEIFTQDTSGFIALVNPNAEKSHAPHVLSTPAKTIAKFLLPDGTKLWLNANSELTFPSKFADYERRVKLIGEAFFEVSKSNTPFIIETNHQAIEVLGTQFNVSSFKNSNDDITTLIEGKVRVNSKNPLMENQSFILHKAGQQLSLNQETYKLETVDTDSYTGWMEGWFIFHNVSLHEMCLQLSNWYGLQLDFTAVNSKKYYGEIKRNSSIVDVINLIRSITGERVELKNGTLKISQ